MNEQVDHFDKCLSVFYFFEARLTWLFTPLDIPGSILHVEGLSSHVQAFQANNNLGAALQNATIHCGLCHGEACSDH